MKSDLVLLYKGSVHIQVTNAEASWLAVGKEAKGGAFVYRSWHNLLATIFFVKN